MIGKTFSHYRIDDELGRGGMGVVYKATDTKLNRTVALKILPASALASEDERARFFREAQAAAQLSHPNVCHVYQVDEAIPTDEGEEALTSGESRPFIAMEFIDGESLRDAIGASPMKLREAVRLAGQVAEALKAAHGKDIVHRDIKSQNIMLTNEGDAKVLDFGLAKTAQSTMLTQMGATLGTVAYMSPEQARGDTVDSRTDLWSLGVVFYEMITGRLPFAGEYEKAVIYGILNEMPEPLTAVRTGVPMGLEWIVSKLLAKNPDERYQTATDLIVDLKTVDLSSSGMSRTSNATSLSAVQSQIEIESHPAPTSSGVPNWVWPVIIATLVIGAAVGWFFKPSPNVADRPIIRFNQSTDVTETISYLGRKAIAISPDGKTIAYPANNKIFFRRMDDLQTALELPGTDNAVEVFFSSDGSQLGYVTFANESLMRIPVTGGSPLKVSDLPASTFGATWGHDGFIYVGLGPEGIVRVLETGGAPEVLIEADSLGTYYHRPQVLPSGTSILYTAAGINTQGWDGGEMRIRDVITGADSIIHGPGTDFRYIETGHVVYRLNGALFAFGFDPSSMEVLTGAAPVVESVNVTAITGTAQWDVSKEGTLVKLPGGASGNNEGLSIYNYDGDVMPGTTERRNFAWPRFSPDGERIIVAVNETDGTSDIWVYDVTRGVGTRYSTSDEGASHPIWSPNGSRIAYVLRGSTNSIVSQAFGSPGNADTLYTTNDILETTSWSPDGENILFNIGPVGQSDIAVLDVDKREVRVLVDLDTDDDYARFSPSGRWFAYESFETDNNEIYITAFPEAGSKIRVSINGGQKPEWSKDESTIFFLGAQQNNVHSAPFDPEQGIVGPVSTVLDSPLGSWQWSVDDARNRWVVVEPDMGAGDGGMRFEFVVNWFKDLNERVPLDR